MQVCKYCSYEFDDALDRCPECGTKVRRKKDKSNEPDLALIATLNSAPEAEILCSILQSENIAFLTECPDGFSSVFGGIGGQVEVYVKKEDEQKALSLLEDFSSEDASFEEQTYWQEDTEDPSEK